MNRREENASANEASLKTKIKRAHESLPAVSLPKGGGAIRGIGEKFAANPVLGSGALTIPLGLSPGRSDFGPDLSLTYNSGSGNGPFGVGWSLSLPRISRKTSKGLPKYQDAVESDVFILSGVEDLVPVLDDDGQRVVDHTIDSDYIVHRYRPRIEGLFAKIERWTKTGSGRVHWRTISKDNVTSTYGFIDEADSRVRDAANDRTFEWLLDQSYDARGNVIDYRYAAENEKGVETERLSETNRLRTAARYIKRIRYGNTVSRLVSPNLAANQWLFEAVFDYGQGHVLAVAPDSGSDPSAQNTYALATDQTDSEWASRPDPFSTYRAGFEIRSHRRCHRVLMFHHFKDEIGEAPTLVSSTRFDYDDWDIARADENDLDAERSHPGSSAYASFIKRIERSGYRRQAEPPVARAGSSYLTYLVESLPPIELTYSKARINERIQSLDSKSLANLPQGVDGSNYRFVDLDGEGLPGLLTRQAGAWHYKRNLGQAKFGPSLIQPSQPSLMSTPGSDQLIDLSGDGELDVVDFASEPPGFHERTAGRQWRAFRSFRQLPNVNWSDPNLRFVDLNGDGHADILIANAEVFTWYPSLQEAGFDSPHLSYPASFDGDGPRLVFANGSESIFLADMSGDGLSDLVRIENGSVCYWPNLGYCRFGRRVQMERAPWFDAPDQFDHARLRLADIDGSGTTDILYVSRNGMQLFFNQAGNAWSTARPLTAFPPVDDLASVTTADLLGNGTACLVWSSAGPAHSGQPLRYIDLMGGQKPHLLITVVNNLGAETRVEYAPSTKYYLADQQAGKPWITKLPFPVHVVAKTTTIDHISGNQFSRSYAYHHGYFDGVEREFRGFGMVEQWDSELFGEATNAAAAFTTAPVLTKSWFHTGAYLEHTQISNFFAGLVNGEDASKYYREPNLSDAEARAKLLPDTHLPAGLSYDDAREACRALKGSLLRQEVYALDADEHASDAQRVRAATPYSVVEQNFKIVTLQVRAQGRHAVFMVHPLETLTYHYERNATDPRTTHSLVLEADDFGNVLKVVNIAYGRLQRTSEPAFQAEDHAAQATAKLTYAESVFTRNVDLSEPAHHHRAPLPAEVRTYELTGMVPESVGARFSLAQFTRNDFQLLADAIPIPFESVANAGRVEKRLIEHTRIYYRKDNLAGLKRLGEVESLALPGEQRTLALTPSMVATAYSRDTNALLPSAASVLDNRDADGGGYIEEDGGWWVPSGRVFYSQNANVTEPELTAAAEAATAKAGFYQPRLVTDAFHQKTKIEYDRYSLLPIRSEDAEENVTQAQHDYHVLKPKQVTDANGNQALAEFNALGLVVATAVKGKVNEEIGDELSGFAVHPTPDVLGRFTRSPHSQASGLLGNATARLVYDLDRFRRAKRPPYVATLTREQHYLPDKKPSPLQISIVFSDGFGREIQTKAQAENGQAPLRAQSPSGEPRPGPLLREADGTIRQGPAPHHRWVGSGRTVFNNKGKPVKQFDPFFSTTHLFEDEADVVETGLVTTLFYDPAERVVATLHADGSYEKVVFDPWQQTVYDRNDTVAPKDGQTGDPRTDTDIQGAVKTYFEAHSHWKRWWTRHTNSESTAAQRDAAQKARRHANTPTSMHFDVLGRPFLTIERNRLPEAGSDASYATRTTFDIEGNPRAVHDALGRLVMRYTYDLVGNQLHQVSMDAGERWQLTDATGQPIRQWNSRHRDRRLTYDALRRPTGLYILASGVERLAERTVYGEGQGPTLNHRGQIFQTFDAAGVVVHAQYDFKGNLRTQQRELLPAYKGTVDWNTPPSRPYESFETQTQYDALNRPVEKTSPDGSVHTIEFNAAGLLEKVSVHLVGETNSTRFVRGVDYDARGRRVAIRYGNGTETTYEYKSETDRLSNLKTTRPAQANWTQAIFKTATVVQDLRYTYDPVGNITRIEDAALPVVMRSNRPVEPIRTFQYDALYRLIKATGREHIGQNTSNHASNRRDYPFEGARIHANDSAQLRKYSQTYAYDAVGNFDTFSHEHGGAGWTRSYTYSETSAASDTQVSNRLSSTTVTGSAARYYAYDPHGNMTKMPGLTALDWTDKDELASVDLSGGGTAYYVYDSTGQRVRKAVESTTGALQKERIYLGGFEIYREYSGNAVSLERKSLHVMDDKRRIAMVEQRTGGTAGVHRLRFNLEDHLGSANVELDRHGGLIAYEEYHPYGTTAFQAGPNSTEVKRRRFRYTGMERDSETGLAYHSARYYAPWIGRWTAADPAGLVDGANLFRYCRNNPSRQTDRAGTLPDNIVGDRMHDLGTPQGRELATAENARKADAKRLRRASGEVGTLEIALSIADGNVGWMQARVDRLDRSARKGEELSEPDVRFLHGLIGALSMGGIVKGMPEAALLNRQYVANDKGSNSDKEKPAHIRLPSEVYETSVVVQHAMTSMRKRISTLIQGGKLTGSLSSDVVPATRHSGSDQQRRGQVYSNGVLLAEQRNRRLKYADNRFKLNASYTANGETEGSITWSVSSLWDFETYKEQNAAGKRFVTEIPAGHFPWSSRGKLKIPDGLLAHLATLGHAAEFTYGTSWQTDLSGRKPLRRPSIGPGPKY